MVGQELRDCLASRRRAPRREARRRSHGHLSEGARHRRHLARALAAHGRRLQRAHAAGLALRPEGLAGALAVVAAIIAEVAQGRSVLRPNSVEAPPVAVAVGERRRIGRGRDVRAREWGRTPGVAGRRVHVHLAALVDSRDARLRQLGHGGPAECGDGALAVVVQGERVALARGRAEVEATEDHGDLTKGSVVGARKNRDEPGIVERCGCVVARRWRRGAGAAGTNLAEFVEEGCRDGLGRRARLRLRLC